MLERSALLAALTRAFAAASSATARDAPLCGRDKNNPNERWSVQ